MNAAQICPNSVHVHRIIFNTSYDDFHTAFMGAENIGNLVEASPEREQLKNVVVAMVLGPDGRTETTHRDDGRRGRPGVHGYLSRL